MEKKDAPQPLAVAKANEASQDLLLEIAGRCMAYEFALKVLIETHPDAGKFAAIWQTRSEQLIESAIESPIYTQNASCSKGMNTTLGRLAGLLRQ